MSDNLMNRAIFGTTVWVALVVLMSGYNLWFGSVKVHLNELGDFIAGAMSPLAIFWLVMVYLQQRKEMHVISNSAKKQVHIMQQEIDGKHDANIRCTGIGSSLLSFLPLVEIENIGGPAANLTGKLKNKVEGEITFQLLSLDHSNASPLPERVGFLGRREKTNLNFKVKEEGMVEKKIIYFDIEYRNVLGHKFRLSGQYWKGMQFNDVFPDPPIQIL